VLVLLCEDISQFVFPVCPVFSIIRGYATRRVYVQPKFGEVYYPFVLLHLLHQLNPKATSLLSTNKASRNVYHQYLLHLLNFPKTRVVLGQWK